MRGDAQKACFKCEDASRKCFVVLEFMPKYTAVPSGTRRTVGHSLSLLWAEGSDNKSGMSCRIIGGIPRRATQSIILLRLVAYWLSIGLIMCSRHQPSEVGSLPTDTPIEYLLRLLDRR